VSSKIPSEEIQNISSHWVHQSNNNVHTTDKTFVYHHELYEILNDCPNKKRKIPNESTGRLRQTLLENSF
jgi:hypothetical protein